MQMKIFTQENYYYSWKETRQKKSTKCSTYFPPLLFCPCRCCHYITAFTRSFSQRKKYVHYLSVSPLLFFFSPFFSQLLIYVSTHLVLLFWVSCEFCAGINEAGGLPTPTQELYTAAVSATPFFSLFPF